LACIQSYNTWELHSGFIITSNDFRFATLLPMLFATPLGVFFIVKPITILCINGNNLAGVYELISIYGMESMPQAMEILFNEANADRANSTPRCWVLRAK
jgi:hypothetical protein